MIGPKRIREITKSELGRLMNRNKADLVEAKRFSAKILAQVRSQGDRALLHLERRFGGVSFSIKDLTVGLDEIQNAHRAVSSDIKDEIKKVANRIEKVHHQQLPRDEILLEAEGIQVKEIYRPLPSVGIYIPGGTAAYPSTVLMLCSPARIAGVEKIVVCTPPTRDGTVNPLVLVALDIMGVKEVYKLGGAQAIAAMAYGTRTVPSVSKIAGPGNRYVTAAKWLVSEEVGIDFPAGPSEVLIIADDSANPKLIAADLISQAEHDSYSVAVLVALSENLAVNVRKALDGMIQNVERQNVVRASLRRYGALLVSENPEDAVRFADQFASEHMELVVEDPEWYLSRIQNAASISVGQYSPVAAADYGVGTNHVLPTAQGSRFHSSLSVRDFMKAIQVQSLTKEGLQSLRKTIVTLSKCEGLTAHGEAIEMRFVGGSSSGI
ncbi:MAG: histidinol dehydrogenase [Candidatus Bathyarchaeia archaeon]